MNLKKAVPVFITTLIVVYIFAFFVFPFLGLIGEHSIDNSAIENIYTTLILLLVPVLGIAAIVTFVVLLVSRLKEIDKEDDDDLSKY